MVRVSQCGGADVCELLLVFIVACVVLVPAATLAALPVTQFNSSSGTFYHTLFMLKYVKTARATSVSHDGT